MQPRQTEAPTVEVSVLIVSHNCVDALRDCLSSLAQSKEREKIEVMVVDNGSSDGCQRIDDEFPEITALRLPHHCGLTKARNIGMRTAKGEYLLLLAPDVMVEPGTVMRLMERLKSDSSALAVCPLLTDENGAMVTNAFQLPDAAAVAAAWRDPATLPAAQLDESIPVHDGKAIFVRKLTIQGINYFDGKYGEHWIDVDLAAQIRRVGKKILLSHDIGARLNRKHRLWQPESTGDRAAFAADAASGAARYLGKYFGFGASLGFRLKLILATLLKTITFQDFSYNASLLSRVVSGSKIDGTSQQL